MYNEGPTRTRSRRTPTPTRTSPCPRTSTRPRTRIHLEHRLPIQVQVTVVLSESLRQHDHRTGSDQTMTPVRKPYPLRLTRPIHIPGPIPKANTPLPTTAAGHRRQYQEGTGQ
jgi:hypothetical protein